MAGQPPEPSFQPSGQDQAMTQGRPAWQQQPPYTPPAGAPAGQQGYGAPAYPPQDQAYGQQDQAYPPPPEQAAYPGPDQGYSGQDQTYTSLGQGQDYQNYPGYQPPSYGAQPGQGQAAGQGQGAGGAPPQWQGIAGVKPGAARTKPAGEKGFLGSLFDFSFNTFVTPKIIKVLYVLVTIWTALIGLTILIIGFKTGGVAGGLFTLIIIEPIFLLLTLGIYRVVLEAFMVVYRIYEETKKIRENGESQS